MEECTSRKSKEMTLPKFSLDLNYRVNNKLEKTMYSSHFTSTRKDR